MNKNRSIYLQHIQVFLNSICAAVIAGITMAVLNVLVEIIKSDSIFGFEDLFVISIWHTLIWIIFGTFMAFIFIAYSLLDKKNIFKNLAFTIYLYTFIACWILIVGYINIYYLPTLISLKSIISNLILFLMGIIIIGIILIRFKRNKEIKTPKILKLIIALQVGVVIISFFLNINIPLLQKKNTYVSGLESRKNVNVIIIVLDAVRSDHLGCYGYSKNTSPSINRLAAEGILFENAFSQSSHTQESIPSLLTSIYPSSINMRKSTSALPHDILTLSSIFKLFGYKTSSFSTIPYVSSTYGYNKGVDDFYEYNKAIITRTILAVALKKSLFRFPRFRIIKNQIFSVSPAFSSKYSLSSVDAHYVTKKIISWISDNHEKPFFIYAHYEGGHTPYDAPKNVKKLFVSDLSFKPITHPDMLVPFDKSSPFKQKAFDNMLTLYDSKIYYHDQNIGFLIDFLEKSGIINNTVIVITSDHGEEFYDHGSFLHGHTLYDELIHVPLILYRTDFISKGKKVQDLVEHVDVFPTLLNLCGILGAVKLPYKIEGKDFSSVILSSSFLSDREYVFSEVNKDDTHSISCIRTKKYKAIMNKTEDTTERLLFDLISDPREEYNIYNEKMELGKELFHKLNAIIEHSKKKAFKPRSIIIDEKTEERLKALGYIK